MILSSVARENQDARSKKGRHTKRRRIAIAIAAPLLAVALLIFGLYLYVVIPIYNDPLVTELGARVESISFDFSKGISLSSVVHYSFPEGTDYEEIAAFFEHSAER